MRKFKLVKVLINVLLLVSILVNIWAVVCMVDISLKTLRNLERESFIRSTGECEAIPVLNSDMAIHFFHVWVILLGVLIAIMIVKYLIRPRHKTLNEHQLQS
jgi:hypothetical protein